MPVVTAVYFRFDAQSALVACKHTDALLHGAQNFYTVSFAARADAISAASNAASIAGTSMASRA